MPETVPHDGCQSVRSMCCHACIPTVMAAGSLPHILHLFAGGGIGVLSRVPQGPHLDKGRGGLQCACGECRYIFLAVPQDMGSVRHINLQLASIHSLWYCSEHTVWPYIQRSKVVC